MTKLTETAKKKGKGGRSKFLSALMRQISTDHGESLVRAFDSKDKGAFAEHFKTLGSKLRRSMGGLKSTEAAHLATASREEVLANTTLAIVEAADLASAHLSTQGLSRRGMRRRLEDAIIAALADTEEVPAEPEAPPQDAIEHLTYEDDKAAKLSTEHASAGSLVLKLTRGHAFSLTPEPNDRFLLTAGEQSLTVNAATADALRMRSVEA